MYNIKFKANKQDDSFFYIYLFQYYSESEKEISKDNYKILDRFHSLPYATRNKHNLVLCADLTLSFAGNGLLIIDGLQSFMNRLVYSLQLKSRVEGYDILKIDLEKYKTLKEKKRNAYLMQEVLDLIFSFKEKWPYEVTDILFHLTQEAWIDAILGLEGSLENESFPTGASVQTHILWKISDEVSKSTPNNGETVNSLKLPFKLIPGNSDFGNHWKNEQGLEYTQYKCRSNCQLEAFSNLDFIKALSMKDKKEFLESFLPKLYYNFFYMIGINQEVIDLIKDSGHSIQLWWKSTAGENIVLFNKNNRTYRGEFLDDDDDYYDDDDY